MPLTVRNATVRTSIRGAEKPSPDRPSPDRPSPDRPSPERPSPERPSPDRGRDAGAAAEAGPAASQSGSLGDADLARELAQLTALDNRQVLGTDSPSGPNRAPQILLSLFSQA